MEPTGALERVVAAAAAAGVVCLCAEVGEGAAVVGAKEAKP